MRGRIIRAGSSLLTPGQVLIDICDRPVDSGEKFGFKIVPHSEERRQILSVFASPGDGVEISGLCELTVSLLLAFNEWRGAHHAPVTIPANRPFTVPWACSTRGGFPARPPVF